MKTAVLVLVAFGAFLVMPAANASLIFTTVLLGTNEVPPSGSPATGFATVILEDDLITLDVSETFSGLVSPASAAHIHCCGPVGTNDPVRLPFVNFPAVTSGTYIRSFNLMTDLTGITPSAFIAGLETGQAYANIHDSTFPGGEIRGQLAAAAVPEPATLALLGIGLAGLGFSRRRKTN